MYFWRRMFCVKGTRGMFPVIVTVEEKLEISGLERMDKDTCRYQIYTRKIEGERRSPADPWSRMYFQLLPNDRRYEEEKDR